MNTKIDIIAASLLVLLTACAPQAELVKTKSELSDLREDIRTSKASVQDLEKRDQDVRKRLDTLEANIKGTIDAQKVMADYGARSDQLATDIQMLQGRLEENNFRLAELGNKLDDKSFKITELMSRIDELEARLRSGETPAAEKKQSEKTVEPSEAYRQSLNDYNSGNYDLALAGFRNYLAQFPDASQADKAQYWVGESQYAKKEFRSAIESFLLVIKNYPKSDKVPAAKLKIGYSYLNEKNNAKAREWLNKVIKEHPGTKEAALAKERLQKSRK